MKILPESSINISSIKWKLKKRKLEDFKTAISSTVRSLSNSQKNRGFFWKSSQKSEKNSIKLPDIRSNINNKLNYEEIRAIADSKSLSLDFQIKKHLKNMSQREIFQKNFMKFLKKLDVKKLEQVILKV